jgi:hypothetical protein
MLRALEERVSKHAAASFETAARRDLLRMRVKVIAC